jgi:hypothetical protein
MIRPPSLYAPNQATPRDPRPRDTSRTRAHTPQPGYLARAVPDRLTIDRPTEPEIRQGVSCDDSGPQQPIRRSAPRKQRAPFRQIPNTAIRLFLYEITTYSTPNTRFAPRPSQARSRPAKHSALSETELQQKDATRGAVALYVLSRFTYLYHCLV